MFPFSLWREVADTERERRERDGYDDRMWPDIKRRWQQDRWLSIPATILILAACAVAVAGLIFIVLVLYAVIA
jgi:hypothetical protein